MANCILCILFVFPLTKIFVSGLDYTLTSPDGIKDLWCPNDCFIGLTDLDSRKCCACDGIPNYELPKNIGNLMNLHVEILNVRGNYKLLMPQVSSSQIPTYQFIYTGMRLKVFPFNLCDINPVKIDVSYNLFTEIGNISCLTELDTLIMTNNRITVLTNGTFLGLPKLRYVDLSFNLIREMDYNVFQLSDLFTLKMAGNYLHEIDIANLMKFNKTACGTNYANAKTFIEMTNKANFQVGEDAGVSCNDVNLSNVSFDTQPLFLISKSIDFRLISKYVPCGQALHYGSAYNCDCTTGDFFHLLLPDVIRLMQKEDKDNFCSSPTELQHIKIADVYNNQTLRDLMICDVVDYCPKNGNCKCTCTSQPNQRVLIVDCSNQSCTDFPEIVPETRYDIILNMSYNKITNIHTNRPYFSQVKILDMRENAVTEITDGIPSLIKVTDVIIIDHRLSDLPKSIQLLDPNIFHFGNNGIPCTCDNRWIGEWRSIKKASQVYPFALKCSNFDGILIERDLENLLKCEPDINLKTVISVTLFLFFLLLTTILSYCFRYEILIGRRLLKLKSIKTKIWEIDVYISFEDENEEIRSYIMVDLENFFKKERMTTYIQCRDAWFGCSEEDNVRNHMAKCKYALIVQTKGMYTNLGRHQTRRFEYRLAWDLMMSGKLAKIFIIQFDRGMEKFMESKTRALKRMGLTLDICERKRRLYDEILKAFDEPIIVNSKHKFQRGIQIKANLLKKKMSPEIDVLAVYRDINI